MRQMARRRQHLIMRHRPHRHHLTPHLLPQLMHPLHRLPRRPLIPTHHTQPTRIQRLIHRLKPPPLRSTNRMRPHKLHPRTPQRSPQPLRQHPLRTPHIRHHRPHLIRTHQRPRPLRNRLHRQTKHHHIRRRHRIPHIHKPLIQPAPLQPRLNRLHPPRTPRNQTPITRTPQRRRQRRPHQPQPHNTNLIHTTHHPLPCSTIKNIMISSPSKSIQNPHHQPTHTPHKPPSTKKVKLIKIY